MRVCGKCRKREPRRNGDRQSSWCLVCYQEWEVRRSSPAVRDGLNQRFEAKVTKGDGCWVWTGAVSDTGYGSIGVEGKTCYAHRVAYENASGPIPSGFEIDHRCRNHECVRPDHLEAVTRQENQQRGANVALKTHCAPGRHPWTDEHIYVRPGNGKKMCGTCNRERSRQVRHSA